MIKTKITEITEKYNDNGKLVEKITREEITEDDTKYMRGTSYNPETIPKDWWKEITCLKEGDFYANSTVR